MVSCTPQCAQLPHSASDWIAELTATRLFLNPDQRYLGSCILVLQRHAVEVTDLSPSEYEALWADVRQTSVALQTACKPGKLNIATLGNLVPHLHVHLILRRPNDAAWPQAIWAQSLPPVVLEAAAKAALITQIRQAFVPLPIGK